MDRRYVYFVSYWFTNGLNAQGFGNCELFRSESIDDYQGTVDMAEEIERTTRHEPGGHHVTILGWELLQIQRRGAAGWEKVGDEKGIHD